MSENSFSEDMEIQILERGYADSQLQLETYLTLNTSADVRSLTLGTLSMSAAGLILSLLIQPESKLHWPDNILAIANLLLLIPAGALCIYSTLPGIVYSPGQAPDVVTWHLDNKISYKEFLRNSIKENARKLAESQKTGIKLANHYSRGFYIAVLVFPIDLLYYLHRLFFG